MSLSGTDTTASSSTRVAKALDGSVGRRNAHSRSLAARSGCDVAATTMYVR
ncbi:uncharacterized protein HHUB_4052 (plasmid) [Halobacterium hubeiense]|uniref:Uncharacterized protein n=1 Tax=Halobacterium hubeiense TaxID=1407499 RepID=A0A0U5AJB8_9EURY|nr:uncharacterized protein HHUB_4052 [Halobacterium hubeiense]